METLSRFTACVVIFSFSLHDVLIIDLESALLLSEDFGVHVVGHHVLLVNLDLGLRSVSHTFLLLLLHLCNLLLHAEDFLGSFANGVGADKDYATSEAAANDHYKYGKNSNQAVSSSIINLDLKTFIVDGDTGFFLFFNWSSGRGGCSRRVVGWVFDHSLTVG